MVGLLSGMILFGLESISRLEQIIVLEHLQDERKKGLAEKVQDQGVGCHSSGRLIGFSPNTVAVGEVNGRYYYEFPVEASETKAGWWRVVVTRWPIMDALGEGHFICH